MLQSKRQVKQQWAGYFHSLLNCPGDVSLEKRQKLQPRMDRQEGSDSHTSILVTGQPTKWKVRAAIAKLKIYKAAGANGLQQKC
jgi:hypothetical protein